MFTTFMSENRKQMPRYTLPAEYTAGIPLRLICYATNCTDIQSQEHLRNYKKQRLQDMSCNYIAQK